LVSFTLTGQELVLWHPHDQKRSLAIPGVVVRQQENQVIIRAPVEGTVREIAVPPDELVER
jgi:multidrug efflux pump subunit AcrA (membrane-fusion protein)